MSILTEEEINQLWIDHGLDECDPEGFARKVESAVLAKLAKLAWMELPPVPNLTQEEREFLHYNPNTGDLVDFVQGHAATYGHQAYAQGAAQVFEQKAAEIEELRIDAECFRLWVHEAWHSPGDICRLLMNCETPADYRAKLVPLIDGQRAAIGKAMG